MKEVKDMNLAECLNELRARPRYNRLIADRIDTLLFEQAQRHDAWVDALENRINSLEAERRWIPVEERLPTKQDGDENGYIFTLEREKKSPNRLHPCIQTWSDIRSDYYYEITHWKRITPPEGV
jgi:hypothetical protein